MKKFYLTLLSLLLLISTSASAGEIEKPRIYVPVLPYEWLFERIGGEWIEVNSIVSEGGDCHDYSPSPKELVGISNANLIFSGDLGFEGNFFVKLGDGVDAPKEISLLEGLDLLEGSCSICEELHAAGKTTGNGEETQHTHDHDELKDPHVWLSPKLLIQQSDRVASILKKFADPAASTDIDSNVAALKKELTALDAELAETLAPMKGEAFYVYHGAFAYFAQAYGLEQKAIEIGSRRPSPKQLTAIAAQAKEDDVRIIFVQPQFDQSSAKSLAETIGGTVRELDPLEKDVIKNLRVMAAAIREIRFPES